MHFEWRLYDTIAKGFWFGKGAKAVMLTDFRTREPVVCYGSKSNPKSPHEHIAIENAQEFFG